MVGQLELPEVEAPRISRQSARECGKVVSLKHWPPLSPEDIRGTHFNRTLSLPQGHGAAGRIKSMKNWNDLIGNRIRALPVYSTTSYPTF